MLFLLLNGTANKRFQRHFYCHDSVLMYPAHLTPPPSMVQIQDSVVFHESNMPERLPLVNTIEG